MIALRWLYILAAALSFNATAQTTTAAPDVVATAPLPRVLIGVPHNIDFSRWETAQHRVY